ncbi:hypothetical protein IMSAGC019_00910 [Lachnospiraceae bacterium]|nr:hypothetical protein IMSAGC019_00910 [Lachnospiraceae bacterium]
MNRVQKVTVRLNEIESKIIRENADKSQISVSEYIRNLIKQDPTNGGTTTPPLESIINNQAHIMWSTETTNGNNT